MTGVQLKPIAGGFAGLEQRLIKATAHALNRVAVSVRASAVKSIGADLGAKQADVRKAVVVYKKADIGSLEAQIVATGKRIPLIDLGARQTRAGVSHQSATGRTTKRSAFIAKMRSGHTGVFKRQKAKHKMNASSNYAGQMRQGIVELFGPSIPLIFTKDKVQTPLRAVIRDRIAIEMKAAARYFGSGK
jgi:hypothetical protein